MDWECVDCLYVVKIDQLRGLCKMAVFCGLQASVLSYVLFDRQREVVL